MSPLSPPVIIYGRAINEADLLAVKAFDAAKQGVAVWVDVEYAITPVTVRAWGASQVFAYLNGGAWENWRPGAEKWRKKNSECLGAAYSGWPGEFWLDIRQPKVHEYLRQQMRAIAMAGYDGVDIDNLNIWQQPHGLPKKNAKGKKIDWQRIAQEHVQRLCTEAKALGLAVSLRHCNPGWANPDAWLIESAVKEGWAANYDHPYVVSLEYGTPQDHADAPCWVVYADRSLKRNFNISPPHESTKSIV